MWRVLQNGTEAAAILALDEKRADFSQLGRELTDEEKGFIQGAEQALRDSMGK
jgi:hypothetical protein